MSRKPTGGAKAFAAIQQLSSKEKAALAALLVQSPGWAELLGVTAGSLGQVAKWLRKSKSQVCRDVQSGDLTFASRRGREHLVRIDSKFLVAFERQLSLQKNTKSPTMKDMVQFLRQQVEEYRLADQRKKESVRFERKALSKLLCRPGLPMWQVTTIQEMLPPDLWLEARRFILAHPADYQTTPKLKSAMLTLKTEAVRDGQTMADLLEAEEKEVS